MAYYTKFSCGIRAVAFVRTASEGYAGGKSLSRPSRVK